MVDRDLLCDADVLSLVRDPGPAFTRLRAWWDAMPAHRRIMTVTTYEEMMYGAEHLEKRKEGPDPARAAAIRHRILSLTREVRAMAVTREVAAEFAALRAEPSLRCLWTTDPRKEHPNSAGDVWLAAFSRVTGTAIATGNVKDFLKVQAVAALPGVYDPFNGTWPVPVT